MCKGSLVWLVPSVVGIIGLLGAISPAQEAKEPEKVELFNGKDFEGWKLFIPDETVDPKTVWEARDGVIHCKGEPNGYMRTVEEYENYRISFEWRWTERPGNSGFLMHIQGEDKVWPKCIESQLMSENAGDFYAIDGTDFKERVDKSTTRLAKRHPHNEKPIGEWNKMVAECQDNTIRIWVNDLLQNEATEATVSKGYIALQSEGAPIEFRNIVLEPLSKSEG